MVEWFPNRLFIFFPLRFVTVRVVLVVLATVFFFGWLSYQLVSFMFFTPVHLHTTSPSPSSSISSPHLDPTLWTPSQVSSWVQKQKGFEAGKYSKLFLQSEIDGTLLLRLNQ